uniref:SPXN protein n=1 Tax=Anser cygnoides TaxID=8845 RepID=A0A8B9EIW2_ANSCY
AQGLRKLTASSVALFLAVSFISFSWSAPQAHFQRRNWTPQAMLYLKGARKSQSRRDDLVLSCRSTFNRNICVFNNSILNCFKTKKYQARYVLREQNSFK